MARSAGLVVLLVVMAVLAGCAGPGLDKAGGTRARPPVVLTMASSLGDSSELDGFAGEVRRLSGGTMQIDSCGPHLGQRRATSFRRITGAWTLVLDRGHFAVTQEDQQACTWAFGTFTVKGDRFEWLVANGGGIAPDGATDKPGEFWTFRACSPSRPRAASSTSRVCRATPSRRFSSRCRTTPRASAIRGR